MRQLPDGLGKFPKPSQAGTGKAFREIREAPTGETAASLRPHQDKLLTLAPAGVPFIDGLQVEREVEHAIE